MSDNGWRIKRYYAPRVLIDLAQLETSPLGSAIVCLTGPERSIVQNLLAYAHRRSTFVSEYHDDYYLAPSEEEWDEIDALVAELEDKMSGCPEIVTLLEGILAATECACEKLTALPQESWPSGGKLDDQRDYDDYYSPVEYEQGDPPGGIETWPEWVDYKCKAAQRIVDDITALGEKLEVVYTGGAAITFAVFQTLVIGTAVAPPIALVIAILGVLVISGTALAMLAFQQWCQNHKQGLVCAVHLAENLPDARAAVLQYIEDNWDLVLGQPFGEHLFSNAVLSKAFDGGLDVSGYSAAYCLMCSPTGERTDYFDFQGDDYESPDWVLEGGAAWWEPASGCRAPRILGTSHGTSKAKCIVPVPGQYSNYHLAITINGFGSLGDESSLLVERAVSAEGPWYALFNTWLPNMAENDCDQSFIEYDNRDLTGQTHLRYTLAGFATAPSCHWQNAKFEWTLPE